MSSTIVESAAVTIPSCRVNLSTASATNESRVFAGVGRKRHRWGASMHLSCAPAAASGALLPAGRRSLALLSEVCVDFWLSLPLLGRRSRAHRGYPYLDAIACLKTDVDLCIPPVRTPCREANALNTHGHP